MFSNYYEYMNEKSTQKEREPGVCGPNYPSQTEHSSPAASLQTSVQTDPSVEKEKVEKMTSTQTEYAETSPKDHSEIYKDNAEYK